MRDWMGRFGVRGARWQGLLVETFAGWWEDRAPRLGAALAYYTVLSLAPLLVLVTPVASAMLGNTGKARSEIRQQFAQLLGDQGAKAVDDVLSAAGTRYGTPSPAARAISWIVLLFGASGVFAELQEALDTIWEVVPRPGSAAWLAILRKRVPFLCHGSGHLFPPARVAGGQCGPVEPATLRGPGSARGWRPPGGC